jgi:hypothetical protein
LLSTKRIANGNRKFSTSNIAMVLLLILVLTRFIADVHPLKRVHRPKSDTAPKQILIDLRKEDPRTLISDQDVWNERASATAEYPNGRSPLEALLEELSTPE